MKRLPIIKKMYEQDDAGFVIGNKVKFKPEALDNMSEPELINLDLTYEVIKISEAYLISGLGLLHVSIVFNYIFAFI